ncbi:MAG: hypothetical protein M3Y22_15035 [Pseudomonadota bacterium]|nr:hypothetical protein [Pseudomonadota bacterium]
MKDKGNVSKQLPEINDTWAIRGIEPETRTAATMAARRAGLTVGKWCNRALREAATASLKERTPGPTLEDTLAKMAAAIEQQNTIVADRLEALERGKDRTGAESRGNLLGRLYGLLWRPVASSNGTN